MAKLQETFTQLLSQSPKSREEIIQETHEKTGVDVETIKSKLDKLIGEGLYKEVSGKLYYGEYADDIDLEEKTYTQLMELIYRDKYIPVGVTSRAFKVKEPDIFESYSIYSLKKDGTTIRVKSSDKFSFDFAFHHQYLPDDLDGKTFCKIEDMGKYYDDVKSIAEDFDAKVKDAIEMVKNGKSKVCPTTEYDDLLEEFLLTPNAHYNKKFLPLKKHYHELYAKLILSAKFGSDSYEAAIVKNPLVTGYSKVLDSLGATFFNKDGPIKNYRDFKQKTSTNLPRFAEKAKLQAEYINYLFKGATAISPVPSRIGFLYVLDAYRRSAELVRVPIRDIRTIIQLKNGKIPDSSELNYDNDVEIIRQEPQYRYLVDAIHPIVRHAESHLFTRLDEDGETIYIQDDKLKKTFKFSAKELHNKRQEILAGLVPALLRFYMLTDLALKLVSMRHSGFLYRLILVGNTKK